MAWTSAGSPSGRRGKRTAAQARVASGINDPFAEQKRGLSESLARLKHAKREPPFAPAAQRLTMKKIKEIRDECIADDIGIADEMMGWTEEQVRTYFENGGIRGKGEVSPFIRPSPSAADLLRDWTERKM